MAESRTALIVLTKKIARNFNLISFPRLTGGGSLGRGDGGASDILELKTCYNPFSKIFALVCLF